MLGVEFENLLKTEANFRQKLHDALMVKAGPVGKNLGYSIQLSKLDAQRTLHAKYYDTHSQYKDLANYVMNIKVTLTGMRNALRSVVNSGNSGQFGYSQFCDEVRKGVKELLS